MLTVRIQEKNHSESIMVLKLKDGYRSLLNLFCIIAYSRRSGKGSYLSAANVDTLRLVYHLKKSFTSVGSFQFH